MKIALINWPRLIRWPIGFVIYFGLIVPLALSQILWEFLAAGFRAYWNSDMWRLLKATFIAVAIGKDTR